MGGLSEVRERIAAAAERAGRDPAEVTLIAVTKTASDDAVRAAAADGHRDFGENRADRLARGSTLLPGARWHMIGRLQTNKVNRVRPIAALLHSLDRPRLAERWARGDDPAPPVLVQVNVADDPSKAGVLPADAAGLVEHAASLGLRVRGLMTIPPLAPLPEASRPHYRRLAELRDELATRFPMVTELSMGMTNDYEVAVEEGATLLRVGRAIFGAFEESRG
jgi:pyridoxal phosphate enzyme (YggS family)